MNLTLVINALKGFLIMFYLCCLPAPLPVFGIMGEPPHVPVRLNDLWPQDVVLLILPNSHSFQTAVELKGLRTKLQHWRSKHKQKDKEECKIRWIK